MSLLRYAWPHTWVECDSSGDYVFESSLPTKLKCSKGARSKHGKYLNERGRRKGEDSFMQDYGHLSNNGLVEIICDALEDTQHYDEIEKRYIRTKLAKALGVRLRRRPLTVEEVMERMTERAKTLEMHLDDPKLKKD